jgi:hypothetical protein
MLNGRPGNVTQSVKNEIAVAVVFYKQTVTSTSTGGHTPSSYHFPWNNPHGNGGRAFDCAASWNAMRVYNEHGRRTASKYAEFFGPPNTQFVKQGRIYRGAIPNHYNHNHVAFNR